MTGKPTRILYMLDYGTADTDVLRLLGQLSGDGDVELTGLYVEDDDLRKAMQLPGLSEVRIADQYASTLEPERMERELSAHAAGVRHRFESSATRLRVRHAFRHLQGRTIDVVVREASSSDLVLVSRPLRSTGLRARQAMQFAPLVSQHGNLLFINEPWMSGSSIVVLCEDQAAIHGRALAIARRMAEAEQLPLILVTRHPVETTVADRVVTLPDWSEAEIVALCESADARLLVLSSLKKIDWRLLVLALAERLSCSLLRLDT